MDRTRYICFDHFCVIMSFGFIVYMRWAFSEVLGGRRYLFRTRMDWLIQTTELVMMKNGENSWAIKSKAFKNFLPQKSLLSDVAPQTAHLRDVKIRTP